ncbi:MAG: hypothetical protein R3B09_09545 [Nannocystaceae bacterium]
MARAAGLAALGWTLACRPGGPDATASGTSNASPTDSEGTSAGATASGSGTTGETNPSTTEGTTPGTSASASTAETGAPPLGPPTCDAPAPLVQYDGSPSGFVRCSNGVIHRTDAAACTVPPAPPPCETLPGAECTSHEACGGPLGFCDANCLCTSACITDADCAEGEFCLCTGEHLGGAPTCTPALCRTDADCAGSICAGALDEGCLDGGLVIKLGCHGPASECHVNADCPPPEGNFIALKPLCSPEPQFTCGAAGGGCP